MSKLHRHSDNDKHTPLCKRRFSTANAQNFEIASSDEKFFEIASDAPEYICKDCFAKGERRNHVYLIHWLNLRGERVTSDFKYEYETVQEFMNELLGHSFVAKVARFTGSKLDGYKYVVANTEEDVWEEVSKDRYKEVVKKLLK